MRARVGAIRAIVRIQTPPTYDPKGQVVREGRLFGFDTGEVGSAANPSEDLLSVNVSKTLHEPCGRFALHFTPREPIKGYTWADLIPGYSLVEIWLQRHPDQQEPVLVMLGLSGAGSVNEDFSQAAPQRQVTVAGRELSCIFVDQRTLYIPTPPQEESARPVVGAPAQLPALFTPQAQALGMIAIDPELVFEGASPVDAIDRFVRMVTTGLRTSYNPDGLPLLNLSLPDARLESLLFFRAEKATAALFDPNARLPAAAQNIRTGIPLWHLMSTLSDPQYQELFVVSRDLERSAERVGPQLSAAAVEIVFRKKPFAGRIDDNGAIVDQAVPNGSQFGPELLDVPAQTLHIESPDVRSRNLQRTVQDVVNLYYVEPQALSISSPDFRSIFTPILDAGDNAPSSSQRFGLRLLEVRDYYLRLPRGDEVAKQNAFEVATARARLLWGWYRFNPLFYTGAIDTIGMPDAQVGTRLVENEQREYYITSVTHAVTWARSPSLRTRLGVERGWPLT